MIKNLLSKKIIMRIVCVASVARMTNFIRGLNSIIQQKEFYTYKNLIIKPTVKNDFLYIFTPDEIEKHFIRATVLNDALAYTKRPQPTNYGY